MRFTYILRLTVLMICGHATALFAQPRATLTHYSTEQGLSHDIISCMVKDSEGLMWIGTWDGINKFDGQQITSFNSARAVMKNTRVDQIVDHNNWLWIRAYDGRVYRFDKTTEIFTPLHDVLGAKAEIKVKRILSVGENVLWLKAVGGGLTVISNLNKERPLLFSLGDKAGRGLDIPSDEINFFDRFGSSEIYLGTPKGVAKVVLTADGQLATQLLNLGNFTRQNFTAVAHRGSVLYFGTGNGELITFQPKNSSFKVHKVSSSKINYLLPAKKTSEIFATTMAGELITVDAQGNFIAMDDHGKGGLFTAFEDSRGELWLEPKAGGVVRFDRRDRRFDSYSQKNDASRISPLNHFRVFEDRNGIVWCVLRDGGFGYYDIHSNKLNYFYNEPGLSTRRLSNLVTNLLYDSAGVMFLHTDLRGLDKLVFHHNDFQKKILNTAGLFKSDNDVRAVLCDSKNRVWVGARSGILYVYQGDQRVNIRFVNQLSGGIGSVYAFCQSKDGAIWMGTKDKGLVKAVPTDESQTSYRLEHYLHDPKDVKSISSDQIYAVQEDQQGNVWVGSYDGGLNLLPAGQGKNGFQRLDHKKYGYPLGFGKIRNMAFDRAGRLWIGSTAGLVICRETAVGKYSFVSYGAGKTLLNYDIQYVFRDHSGKMWLGTSGGGLHVWDGKSPINKLKFKAYTKEQGLDNDYILSICEDRNRQIWAATKSAISSIEPKTGKVQNYNSYDGIPKDSYSEASATYTKDGRLVVGTINGLLIFNPSQIKNNPIRAKMVFTKLQVNNKDVGIDTTGGILTKNINHIGHIFLDHDQNILSIDYTILDYRDGKRINYLYRLKGFDSDWQENKGQTRATYTNLSPGEYTFEVKGADIEDYVGVPQKSLTITIAPPFWKTWWAYLSYLAVLVFIFILVKRVVTTFLHLRQEIAVEQKMSAMKMSFFTNVSHELRTPLTLILNPVEQILKGNELSGQTKEYAKVIQNNAKRMVHFVNQLLDLRKAHSGQSRLRLSTFDANELMEKIAAYFQQEVRAKEVFLGIDVEPGLQMTADVDKVETVIHNLLGNAFKFASAGQKIGIVVVSDQKDWNLSIVVTDQGPGVPDSDLETIFQLYHESRNPQTQHIKGTGIGLALARELIALHGGKIFAENLKPQGLAVTIQLPLLLVEAGSPQPVYPQQSDREAIDVGPIPTSMDPEIKIGEKQSILLVEDNQDMREFLQSLLKDHYIVDTAIDGADGLDKARKSMPDMIVSDVMMPNMSGIVMLQELKNDMATSHIPIILLSAKNALESQIEGLKYGADYYIGKPFDNDFLFAAIESMLKQRKRMFERWISNKKIVEIGTDQVSVTARDEQFLHRAVTVIEERLADPGLDIDTIAKLLHMSRTAFFIKFKSLTQQAPVEVVRDMRLKVAKQQLDDGAGNISEISYAVGFSNAKYFSTCFRAAYGISPSDYLKSIRK